MLSTYTQVDNGLGSRLSYYDLFFNNLVFNQHIRVFWTRRSVEDTMGGMVILIYWVELQGSFLLWRGDIEAGEEQDLLDMWRSG